MNARSVSAGPGQAAQGAAPLPSVKKFANGYREYDRNKREEGTNVVLT